jgi:hypothetical protein
VITSRGWASAPYIGDLIHWIRERENVRKVKEELDGVKPYSLDPIFQTTRFCNVHREDDKVTRWLKVNWRDPNSEHPNLAFSMCLARIVNWPSTLAVLGFPFKWSKDQFITTMTDLSGGGSKKIWGGAYMVTGGYSAGGETKQVIMGRVLDEAYTATRVWLDDGERTLKECFSYVSSAKGLGTFLAAQVVADLKYTPLLEKAPDWVTFCAPGPGSTMGLNFLQGRPPTKGISEKQFSLEVNDLRVWLEAEIGVVLTAHDTQNCLCEFSKYVRIKYFGGRAKTGYPGR